MMSIRDRLVDKTMNSGRDNVYLWAHRNMCICGNHHSRH